MLIVRGGGDRAVPRILFIVLYNVSVLFLMMFIEFSYCLFSIWSRPVGVRKDLIAKNCVQYCGVFNILAFGVMALANRVFEFDWLCQVIWKH